MKKIFLFLFLTVPAIADQCQITSPLPVPVSISGCTFSGILPGNSTSYIQNSLSPTTTTQIFSVQAATATASFTLPFLTAGQCLTTNSAGLVITTSCGSGGGGSGASTLAVNQNGVQVTSPTIAINFIGPPFIVTSVGAGTTSQLTLDPSSVTLQGNNLSATYLTNSSATATYLQLSSATATYLQQVPASNTYLTQSSASVTYGQLAATQTWTGENNWSGPGVSTFTYGVNFGSITLNNNTSTGVLFLSGKNMATTSTFEWNGTTMSATNITTSTSTVTNSSHIIGPNGENITYGISVGSMTGAGLITCGDSTHALAWSSASNQFNCQTISTLSTLSATNPILYNTGTGVISATPISLSTGIVGTLGTSNGGTALNTAQSATQPIVYNSGTGVFSSTLISLTTDVMNILPATNMVSTAAFTSTNQIFTAPQTFSSSITVSGTGGILTNSITYSTSPIKTGAYSATCNDEVLLGSATLVSASTITLPATSSCPGQTLKIWKVDSDTGALVIQASGSDVVIGTGTIKLYATGQGGAIQSDGAGHWFADGAFYTNPPLTGSVWPALLDTAEPVTASSTTAASPFLNTNPVWVCGYRYRIATGGGAGSPPSQMNLAVYDGNNGNLISSVGPISDVATGIQTAISPPFYLSPNYPYLIAWQPNNTTATINTVTGALPPLIGGFSEAAATLTLPNPLSFATVAVGGPLINLITCGGPWSQ